MVCLVICGLLKVCGLLKICGISEYLVYWEVSGLSGNTWTPPYYLNILYSQYEGVTDSLLHKISPTGLESFDREQISQIHKLQGWGGGC